MDTPKISKLLRRMKLLTGNVSRTIDSLSEELGVTQPCNNLSQITNDAIFVKMYLYGKR